MTIKENEISTVWFVDNILFEDKVRYGFSFVTLLTAVNLFEVD